MRNATAWWLLIGLWLVCAGYLLMQGHTLRLALATAAFLFWGLHTWLSVRITHPAPTLAPVTTAGSKLIWLQVAVVLLLAAIANQPLPLWGALVDGLRGLGEQTVPVEWVGGPSNVIANPVQYFVIPLLVLWLLGAKPGELGLQRGWRSWQVAALWLAIPLVMWVVLLATGQITGQTVARRLIGNALQNGFFEEFLFRGALQSRLHKVLAADWALVLQALIFGLWHINANLRMFEGDWLGALAWCVVSQTMIGLLFGILFQRTRSLIAPSVAHVVSNAFGQTF